MRHPTIDLIERRVSANRFDPTHSLADTEIKELVRLATRATSAFNLQNWRFIAVRTTQVKEELRDLAYGQIKVSDAAVTFIICGQRPDHETIAERLRPFVETGLMPASMAAEWQNSVRIKYADDGVARDEAILSATPGAAALIYAAEAMSLVSGPMVGFDASPSLASSVSPKARFPSCSFLSAAPRRQTGLRSRAVRLPRFSSYHETEFYRSCAHRHSADCLGQHLTRDDRVAARFLPDHRCPAARTPCGNPAAGYRASVAKRHLVDAVIHPRRSQHINLSEHDVCCGLQTSGRRCGNRSRCPTAHRRFPGVIPARRSASTTGCLECPARHGGVGMLVLTPDAALDPIGIGAGLLGALSMALGGR